MPINLKHINTSDSDNIKLDIVNYNFDQLVANGGGPRGAQGSIGETGTQGNTGKQGVQGPIGDAGFQGAQGPISNNYWKKIAADSLPINADTLIPIYTATNQFAPVINIGYIEIIDQEYGTKSALVGGKTPYQWNIYRQQYSISNLRFLDSNITNNAYDFRLEKFWGKDRMTMGFLDIGNSISTYRSASTSFRSSISSPDSLLINSSGTFFKTETVFDSPASIITGLVIGNQGANINEIAISADNTGRVTFKSVQELGGTVPFGSIVSILPSIFADNTKFRNTESIPSQGDTSPVRISVGKGIGNYEGWYLCHGKQWTNGVDTHQVPSLGRFNYHIDDNPFSQNQAGQGIVNSSNFRTHITGGSNINMTATSVSATVYNVTSNVETSSIIVEPSSGTTFKIKQLPQIIYLGKGDLYWFDGGQNHNPPVSLTFLLDDGIENLVPNPYTLNTITNHGTGDSYSFTSEVLLPAGYYWSTVPTSGDITGLPAYAAIPVGGITVESGAYPTKIFIVINISSHPGTSRTETLNINTATFISALTVQHSYLLSTPEYRPAYATAVDDGTDGTLDSIKQASQIQGSTYSFPVTITANGGYYFTQTQVNNLTLQPGSPSRIQIISKTLVNSTTIAVTLRDANFPSGGSTIIMWSGTAIIIPIIPPDTGIYHYADYGTYIKDMGDGLGGVCGYPYLIYLSSDHPTTKWWYRPNGTLGEYISAEGIQWYEFLRNSLILPGDYGQDDGGNTVGYVYGVYTFTSDSNTPNNVGEVTNDCAPL